MISLLSAKTVFQNIITQSNYIVLPDTTKLFFECNNYGHRLV
jgi:hypothetical protein